MASHGIKINSHFYPIIVLGKNLFESALKIVFSTLTSFTVMECPSLTNPAKGQVLTPYGLVVGSKAYYTCNEHYTLDGVGLRMCLDSGE